MKHTPTPWKLRHDDTLIVSDNDNTEETICRFFDRYEDDFPNSKANAARIAACVNALEGIENPEQWIATSKSLLNKIRIHVETTEECLDNFNLPRHVVELMNQDLDLFREVITFLKQGGQNG